MQHENFILLAPHAWCGLPDFFVTHVSEKMSPMCLTWVTHGSPMWFARFLCHPCV